MIYMTELLQNKDIPLWEEFIQKHEDASNYHRIGWRGVIEESFGHSSYYLVAKDESGEICGILPLVFMKSWLFGKYCVSMPFLNYGGILSAHDGAEEALMKYAIEIAKERGASHIELRQSHIKPWEYPVKTRKVSMRLSLPPSSETLWSSFSSKLRSQIKKPLKEGMEARWGREDQLDAFYDIFSVNMRDLGTPVYAKSFFKNILREYPTESYICIIYWKDQALAAGFLTAFRDTIEIPWASSLRRYNQLSPNMLLYWNVLKFACDREFRTFDFGRSTVWEGTYKFKEQWGAKPVPLYWYYPWIQDGELPEVNVNNPKYKLMIGLWRRLPIWVTRQVGPKVVRGIA